MGLRSNDEPSNPYTTAESSSLHDDKVYLSRFLLGALDAQAFVPGWRDRAKKILREHGFTSRSPPLPQDNDPRPFEAGSRVSAWMNFSHDCPPGPERVMKGTLGRVTGDVEWVDDEFSGRIRMVPVAWDTGRVGKVIDRLLVLEMEGP